MIINRSSCKYVLGSLLVSMNLVGCNKEIDDSQSRRIDRSKVQVPLHLLSINAADRYARTIDGLVDFQMVFSAAQVIDGYEDILTLWFQGYRSTVELMWYKKDDRLSRTLIMALILANQEDDRLSSFLYVCDRFEEQERKLRKEEIMYIARNREKYSNMIYELEMKVRELTNGISMTYAMPGQGKTGGYKVRPDCHSKLPQ